MIMVSRRGFLFRSSLAATAVLMGPAISIAQQKKEKPPALTLELVKDFVVKGHGDLSGVQALLEEEPGLLNASWDWGGGDFETAIGGAGHMGRKDIALYLLSKGTRMDIFVAAMLGKLDIVKPALELFPELTTSKGPHGFTLMTHAKKGGDEAIAVVEYLKSLGVDS